MSITAAYDGHDGVAHGGRHHESLDQRDQKEHLALWLFIGGDLVFFLLEIFTWFYLKSLNTNGMWRGSVCTTQAPCPTGLANNGNYGVTGIGLAQITRLVPRADPSYTLAIAALTIVTALLFLALERTAAEGGARGAIVGMAMLPVISALAAVCVQCYQFGQLPFTTIEGSYASSFEFFMGSDLAHDALLLFLAAGIAFRARRGKYSEGNPWYQLRLIRIFSTWCAFSVVILALVMSYTS